MNLDPTHASIAATVENIADAVTHAQFVGSDDVTDGVVLMKFVQVLRTLMLSPEGSALTNESVCEVMLACFRICFEPRLNELLRRSAEHALKDIVLLLFMRLPQFAEERNANTLIKKLKMMANGSGIDSSSSRRRKTSKGTSGKNMSSTLLKNKTSKSSANSAPAIRCDEVTDTNTGRKADATDKITSTPNNLLSVQKQSILATTPSTPVVGNIVDMQGKFTHTPQPDRGDITTASPSIDCTTEPTDQVTVPTIDPPPNDIETHDESIANDADVEEEASNDSKVEKGELETNQQDQNKDEKASTIPDENSMGKGEDFVNSMGIRFTPQTETDNGAFLFSNLHKTKKI